MIVLDTHLCALRKRARFARVCLNSFSLTLPMLSHQNSLSPKEPYVKVNTS